MKKPKRGKPEQSEKFIQTAKDHGCEESEADFADKMKKLAHPEKDGKKK